MGLSSSSSKTSNQSTSTAAPSTLTSPYITQGLQDSQAIMDANQGTLQGLSSAALSGFNAIAPQSYSASPYVTAAQAANQNVASGSNVGTNPGAATYSGLMQPTTNPASAALSGIANGTSANPATATLSSIANGNPAVNPYVDQITQQATDAATKAANQRFGASGMGAGLSSAYDASLGSAVAAANNSTRYAAYDDAANRQLSAASSLGSEYNQGQANQTSAANALGSIYNQDQQTQLSAANAADTNYQSQLGQQLTALGQTSDLRNAGYAGIAPTLSLANAAASLPYTGIDAYAGLMGTLANPYATTSSTGTGTTTTSGNLMSSLLSAGGSALSGWATGGFKTSDRRTKTDIIKLREEPDGLGVYSYRYKAGGPVRVGVMADEVARIRPWALGPRVADVATVNYGAL